MLSAYRPASPIRRIAAAAAVLVGAGSLTLLAVTPVAAAPATSTVSVGSSPWGIALSPDDATAYVTNASDNTVSVVDTATFTVVATVAVGSGPNSIVENSAGTRVYVGNTASGTVSVIDTATNTVTATISGPSQAMGLALSPDGSTLYVGDSANQRISVIDTSTRSTLSTIGPITDPRFMRMSPDGTTLYVAGPSTGDVSMIDTATGTISHVVHIGAGAFGMALTPDGTGLYVADNTDYVLDLIDLATRTVTETISVGSTPIGVAISPDGSTVYVANIGSSSISEVDTASGTVTNAVAVSGPYQLALSADGSVLYAAAQFSSALARVSGLLSAPSAPLAPMATAGPGSATVTFTIPATVGTSAITGYDYSLDGGSTWLPLSYSVSGSTVTGTITGLTGGQTYQVSLRARNAVGAGASIAPVTVTPSVSIVSLPAQVLPASTAPAPGAPPATAPGHVSVASGNRDLAVSFTRAVAVKGVKVTGYEVSTDAGTSWHTADPVGSSTLSVAVTGLSNGRSYDVEVRATTTVGPGDASTAVRATLSTSWLRDPVSAAARRSEIPVPADPASYVGPVRNTTSFGRAHNGTIAIPAAKVENHHLSRGQAVSFTGLFAFDSATLTKAGRAELRMIAASLRGNAAITCEGYADYSGDRSHEQALATRRAQAICAALVSAGAQVKTKATSYGSTTPATVGGTAAARDANRRVVVLVTR